MSLWVYNLFAKVKEPLWGARYNTRDELIRDIGNNKNGRVDGVRHLPNIGKRWKNNGVNTILKIKNIYKYPQLVSNTQGRVKGWHAMKPLYYSSVSSKGAGRPRLTHHHKGWWNETKWMRWVWRNGEMKFVVGENGRNPEKNLPRLRFVHHETNVGWPRRGLGTPAVRGERLTACATRPPATILKVHKCYTPVNKAMSEISYSFHYFYPTLETAETKSSTN